MQAGALLVQRTGKQARIPRHPQHPYRIGHKPWEIQPFLLAPVLPGETLKNISMQSRVVSDPWAAPLVGGWIEHYFFYIRIRQMDTNSDGTTTSTLPADFMALVLDASATLSTTLSVSSYAYTNDTTGKDWMSPALAKIVAEWFRDQGETPASRVIRTGRYAARINQESFINSLTDTTAVPDGGTVSGTAEAQERLWIAYQYARGQKFTEMTFEDWLATFGVNSGPAQDRDKPELIRYSREWSYPTNTVDPTTGVPTSALSYSCNVRADKDRFFDEPGFIVGLSVFRPKVYRSNQKSNASVMLDNAYSWMPAILKDTPESSLREFTNAQGPLGDISAPILTNGYFLDMRDLYSYGDQWVDDAAATGMQSIAIPTAAQVHKYATETIADTLFSGANKYIHQDGVCALTILGTQWDHT